MASRSMTRTCAYCHSGIKPGSAARACIRCGVVLHVECWEESRRCPTFGCPGELTSLSDAEPDGAPMGTCPHCGMRIRAQAIKCRYCRRPVTSSISAAAVVNHRVAGSGSGWGQASGWRATPPGSQSGGRTGFCWWGLLFGGLWYLANGMWRKGLVLVALGAATLGILPGLVAGFCGYEDRNRYEAGEPFWW